MLKQRIEQVLADVKASCIKHGRDPESVRVLPVSKTFPSEVIAQASELGLLRFGENKAQELKEKAQALAHLPLQWVLIGYLQTNKAKEVAKYASEIQSLDRLDLAQTLDRRLQLEGRSIDALIQVKTSSEASKSGMPPEEVLDFIQQIQGLDTLRLKGFMTIAENSQDPVVVRDCFKRLRDLAEQARQATGLELATLSMGMSADYDLAIAEGSTELRIGSAIFGARDYT
ncbi:MAG: YggS family pyridoxal phosphate-dependent enzyme [Pelistega sp.]|nr:YggS family pyridoxal phosphate-dependent enzyme [Pelistega sp.]